MTPMPRRRRLRVEPLEERWLLTAVCETLTLGDPTNGDLQQPGNVCDYHVELTEPGRLTVKMQALDGSALDSFLELFAAAAVNNGSPDPLILQNDDVSATDRSAEIDLHLTPGQYRIRASAALGAEGPASTGQFKLTAQFQPAEAPYVDIPIAGGAQAVVVDYFNGDDILDLVVSSNDSGLIEIFLGLGDGTFQQQEEIYDFGGRGGFIASGDFNGDKKKDVAVGDSVGHDIVLFFGNGTGVFASPKVIDVQSEPEQLAADDLNNDGCDDLAVPTHLHGVQVLFSQKAGNTCEPAFARRELTEFPDTRSVAIQDLNDDGHLDFVAASRNDKKSGVLVWTSQPNPNGNPDFLLEHRIDTGSKRTRGHCRCSRESRLHRQAGWRRGPENSKNPRKYGSTQPKQYISIPAW